MAGYSDTPLAQKLGIKPGSVVALLGGSSPALDDALAGITVRRRASGTADVVIAFFTERAGLEKRCERLGRMIFPAGGLWICFPKRASGVQTDVTDHVIERSLCPVDWSTTRYVRSTTPGPECAWSGGASVATDHPCTLPALRVLMIPRRRGGRA